MGILRTILAIAVVFAHSDWHGGFVLVGGQAAVQCFYVISGYLISYVLLNNKSYSKSLRFYANRALRIYPVYLFVALLSLIAIFFVGNTGFVAIYRKAPASAVCLLVFSNIFLFGQDWVMFSGVHGGHLYFAKNYADSDVLLFNGLLAPQAWTLGIELTFYLLAPFILRNRKILLTLLIVSFVLRLCLLVDGIGFKDPWTYRFFPTELGLFLFGALSQQVIAPIWQRVIGTRKALPQLGTSFLVVFSLTYFLIPVPHIYLLPVYLVLAIVVLPLAFFFQGTMAFDRWIGDLSYPIYIGHMLVVKSLKPVFRMVHIQNDLMIAIVNVIVAILFAIFLNELIAKRFESLRKKLRSVGKSQADRGTSAFVTTET
jgi:peptidoglycan/LPS O-acetylase OafA/YrhL